LREDASGAGPEQAPPSPPREGRAGTRGSKRARGQAALGGVELTSARDEAAVDEVGAAGAVGGVVAREEGGHVGDLLVGAVAVERDELLEAGADGGGGAGGGLVLDGAHHA